MFINGKGEAKFDKSGNQLGAQNTELWTPEQNIPWAVNGKRQSNTKVDAELESDPGQPLPICSSL